MASLHPLNILRQATESPSRLIKYSLIVVSRAVAATGMLLLNIVVARLIGVDALGQLTVAIALLIGCSIVARCGYDQSLLRFAGTAYGLGDHASIRAYLKSAIAISLIMGLVIGGGAVLLQPIFGENLRRRWWGCPCGCYCFNSLFNIKRVRRSLPGYR